MSVRKIFRMGDPCLGELAGPVDEFDTPVLHTLVADLIETMDANDGAGLAATQIGVMKQVVVFGLESNSRYPEADQIPLTVLINPVIEPLSEEMEAGWEGCLSVPGMRGLVNRYSRIRYSGYDPYGNIINREVSGFHARVVQHECDHLEGILYLQRIDDMRYFGFTEELEESGILLPDEQPCEETPAGL